MRFVCKNTPFQRNVYYKLQFLRLIIDTKIYDLSLVNSLKIRMDVLSLMRPALEKIRICPFTASGKLKLYLYDDYI